MYAYMTKQPTFTQLPLPTASQKMTAASSEQHYQQALPKTNKNPKLSGKILLLESITTPHVHHKQSNTSPIYPSIK
jgi:hypothetical protein